MSGITIRPFRPDEWQRFRDFRLAALQESPGMFFNPHAMEAAFPDEKWRASVNRPDQCVFGLFDGENLIGLTAAFTDRDDPTGESALVAMGYVVPSHRGRGLSNVLHEATMAWVRSQPQFRRVVISHRESNTASRGGILKAGFIEKARTGPWNWPDGTQEDDIAYEYLITRN
jgi:RimJ/RimL family protein N-acetyltransferase